MARGRKPTGDRALTAAERQSRSGALKRFNTELRFADDPARDRPIAIAWNRNELLGRITIDGTRWASVEWSEKHQCWCIEDVTGACLAHEDGIRGAAASQDATVALAEAMIRDGRMPSPEQARERRWNALPADERERIEAENAEARAKFERKQLAREKRERQPAVQQRRAEQQRLSEASSAGWSAKFAEERETPLYDLMHEVFDFADPDLWKSNSFAALYPRLLGHVKNAVAKIEGELAFATSRANAQPFAMYQTTEDRRAAAERRRRSGEEQCRQISERLDRARSILAALQQHEQRLLLPSAAQ